MRKQQLGVVAAGHSETANAAKIMLEAGGNAFDASLAAMTTACVAEPILASFGGGGFLLAHTPNSNELYDFFVQTPRQRRSVEALDFYPIHADFGAATQEFHIGKGSIAVPGIVKGIYAIHQELCSMPMDDIFAPAIALARQGVELNSFQDYLFRVIGPILNATPEAHALFADPDDATKLVSEGEVLKNEAFADLLEVLCYEGETLFYQGEIAKQIANDCANAGTLTREDLENYEVIKRRPLEMAFRGHRILTNPLPSTGGSLINFALKLLESRSEVLSVPSLASAMALTNHWRSEGGLDSLGALDESIVAFKSLYQQHPLVQRGTTHISVADKQDNFASLTLSNGEGSGYVIPNTGVMLNNMLGEEDLNQDGFHQWPENKRLSSMMSPCVIFKENDLTYAIGSGGSNRIRTAVLQVILNVLEHDMSLSDAIQCSRIHLEDEMLNIEPGISEDDMAALESYFPNVKRWPEKNLFFGGVHGVARNSIDGTFHGAGDQRRGGVSIVVSS